MLNQRDKRTRKRTRLGNDEPFILDMEQARNNALDVMAEIHKRQLEGAYDISSLRRRRGNRPAKPVRRS